MTRRLAAFLLLTACSTTPDPAAPDAGSRHATAAELARLDGTFASPAPEPWGNGTYGTREFHFADGRWSLRFELGLDPAMQIRVFRFRTEGTYDVTAPSAVGPGIYEARFREAAKYVTLLSDDPQLAESFGLAPCGLTVGVEADISAAGCAIWKPVAVCGDDYDLLAQVVPDQLFFGVRPADNDMCTPDRRPTALLPPVVRR